MLLIILIVLLAFIFWLFTLNISEYVGKFVTNNIINKIKNVFK